MAESTFWRKLAMACWRDAPLSAGVAQSCIESDLIPRTNNTAQWVIRRFDQHYQNFCGFESLEPSAQFLAIVEKVYRFTHFSDDAQPRKRGKSHLQLTGYNVLKLTIAAACNGWAITMPTRTARTSVPNA